VQREEVVVLTVHHGEPPWPVTNTVTVALKARGAAAPCYSVLAQATVVKELIEELNS
jgi:hypothetical protein